MQEILRYTAVLLALQPLQPEGAAGAAAAGEPAAMPSQVCKAHNSRHVPHPVSWPSPESPKVLSHASSSRVS